MGRVSWKIIEFDKSLEEIEYTNKIPKKDFMSIGSFPIISQEAEFINGYWNNEKDVFHVKTPVVVFGDHTKILKYVDFNFVLGADGVKILQPKNYLEPKYFYYYLKNIHLKNLGYSRHYRLLKEINISYPESLLEQKRIAKILDESFEAIAKAKENAEKNLANARELFESFLQNIFINPGIGWEEKRLDEVCEISSKLVDPREKQYVNLFHVGGANIESNNGNLINLKTAKEEQLISGKFVFDKNMVLYSKIRPYLMKVARPDFDGICSADIYPLTPKAILNRDFLYYLLLTKHFTKFAIKGSARAGMPKVNRDYLFSFYFILPPIKEQQIIVAKIDALSAETKKLESIYQQKLANLEELKKAILQKAFNGELTEGIA